MVEKAKGGEKVRVERLFEMFIRGQQQAALSYPPVGFCSEEAHPLRSVLSSLSVSRRQQEILCLDNVPGIIARIWMASVISFRQWREEETTTHDNEKEKIIKGSAGPNL